MPIARASTVATHAWINHYTSWISGAYDGAKVYAWSLPYLNHHHARNLYCLWASLHWWSVAAQTRSKFSCVLQFQLSPLRVDDAARPARARSLKMLILISMRSFEIYGMWLRASIDVQCSPASVRLTQASPNYISNFILQKEELHITTPDLQ